MTGLPGHLWRDPKWTALAQALVRYMHHYERFMIHVKSRELESMLQDSTMEKMTTMQEQVRSAIVIE